MASTYKHYLYTLCLLFICFANTNAAIPTFNYGVMEARNETAKDRFCIMYYTNITNFPSNKSNMHYDPLVDLSHWDGCSNQPFLIQDKYVITGNGNCSLLQKTQIIESLGGKGLIIMTPRQIIVNESFVTRIPVALISEHLKDILVALGNSVEIFMYGPPESSRMDQSLLVIWGLAVSAVGIGAYWSGIVRHDLQARIASATQGKENQQEDVSLSVTPILVGVFVLCMCGMLLLLYFFFTYLVYVIIGLFVLASITAVYQCLEPIVQKIPLGSSKLPQCNLLCLRIHVEIRQLILFAASVTLAAVWVVYRKENFAWILQDILGFAFSVNMLRLVRLPSLRICTLLLVLLFFYDIFFVFITPLITKNGQSIMVEVATGGGSGVGGGPGGGGNSSAEEQLPMMVRVPHLGWDPLEVCLQRYSLLGFGDILVPGMLVAFCHGFDLATSNRRKLYYITTLLAYGLGLLVTFVGLYFMAIAQPALLYLVPCTLIPVFLLGLARRELKLLWAGDGQTPESSKLTEKRIEDGEPVCTKDQSMEKEVQQQSDIDRLSLIN